MEYTKDRALELIVLYLLRTHGISKWERHINQMIVAYSTEFVQCGPIDMEAEVTAVCALANGKQMCALLCSDKIVIINMDNHTIAKTLDNCYGGSRLMHMASSRDGNWLLTVRSDDRRTAQLWQLNMGIKQVRLTGHTGVINAVISVRPVSNARVSHNAASGTNNSSTAKVKTYKGFQLM